MAVQPANTASTNVAQLKKLIKESIKEVLSENDTIKMIIAESVKTAIVTVLTEVKRDEALNTVNEQQKPTLTKYQRTVPDNKPAVRTVNSHKQSGPEAINFMDVLKSEMGTLDGLSDSNDPILKETLSGGNPAIGPLGPDTEMDDLELIKTLGLK